jgi:hypothetical protein
LLFDNLKDRFKWGLKQVSHLHDIIWHKPATFVCIGMKFAKQHSTIWKFKQLKAGAASQASKWLLHKSDTFGTFGSSACRGCGKTPCTACNARPTSRTPALSTGSQPHF